jgi:hypothetical protein
MVADGGWDAKSQPLKRLARSGMRWACRFSGKRVTLHRMPSFRKGSISRDEYYRGFHRFEHWYRDNTVYFITARVRDRRCVFESEAAKAIFWDRFDHYTKEFGYVPFVTSLLDNHYHSEGYLRVGENLGKMIQRLHGSVAKLVNDLLDERHANFWCDSGRQGYFDGCLRSEKQGRKTYRYVHTQCRRHGICLNAEDYPHTRVNVEMEKAIKRAIELNAFMRGVPYKRYGNKKS